MSNATQPAVCSAQLTAFLTMLAQSEGTESCGTSHGYDCLVGSTPKKPVLFTSYADHPRVFVPLRPGLTSSAAGRYQILARNYDAYKRTLKLPDFSPASQDAIAVQMIREQHALSDIETGHLANAIDKCNNVWASLPGSPYGQRTNTFQQCCVWFQNAGGVLAK